MTQRKATLYFASLVAASKTVSRTPFLSQRKEKVDIKMGLFCVVALTTAKQNVV